MTQPQTFDTRALHKTVLYMAGTNYRISGEPHAHDPGNAAG